MFIESKRGALNKYFSTTSNVDVNNNNQMQESEPRESDEQNSNADLEVNEQYLDDSKQLTSIDLLQKKFFLKAQKHYYQLSRSDLVLIFYL
jgi:hypothetical protein